MRKSKWIWMPHAGHLIVANDCRFHLNTYVGGYIVSTVGEYYPDSTVRRIHAEIEDKGWYEKNKNMKGDNFDYVYMNRFGFSDIGYNKKYETMVFESTESAVKCCPYVMKVGHEVDSERYNTAANATEGHYRMCKKWAKKCKE